MHPESRNSLEQVVVAMNDWILTSASEWCNEYDVKEAKEGIYSNGGTVAYVMDLKGKLEHVLKNEP